MSITEPAPVTVPATAATWITCSAPVHHACSKDQTRPVLTGVSFVEIAGTSYLVGTDSYCLAAVPVAELPADWHGKVIPAEAAKAWLKPAKRGALAPRLSIDVLHERCTVADGLTVSTQYSLIPGTFPKVAELIPEYPKDCDGTVNIGINFDLAARVQKAFGKGCTGLKVQMIAPTRAMKVTPLGGSACEHPGAIGLVMPIKIS